MRPRPSLAWDSHRDGLEPCSCPLRGRRPVPLQPQILAKLLLSSQCWTLLWSLSLALCLSLCKRKEGSVARPSHASHSARQSPNLPSPTLAPPPLPHPNPGAQSHFCLSLGPDSLSCTRAPLLFGVIFGCHHCPLWSARIDRDGGFWRLASWFQAFGAKTCEGLWLALWQ